MSGCVVSYPEPCSEPATTEVWGLPFCEVHGREAQVALDEELLVSVDLARDVLVGAESARYGADGALVQALENLSVPGQIDYDAQKQAMLAAYPPERLEPYTDADSLAHDYATRRLGEGPVEWWNDARLLVCKFLRMAAERSEPAIMGGLEELREKATVQQVLAERDYERRYVEPHKAMRPVETAGG